MDVVQHRLFLHVPEKAEANGAADYPLPMDFVEKTAAEIKWSKYVKVASKPPNKIQCTGYHTVPYLTAYS